MNIFDLQAMISLNAEQFNTGIRDAQGRFETFGGNVSKASETLKKGLVLLGGAAVAAGAGIVKGTVDAAYAADDLNTLSKQTGIATDTLQKFQYASDLIDVSMETLTGSLTKLTRNMNSARDGGNDVSDAFDALGVAIVDAEGNLRDREDVFDEVIAALGEIENVTERDATAMQIFGRSAQELNPLIMGGADALKELGQQAEDAGLIMSQDALDGLNQLSDALDTAKATASAFSDVFGTAFAPAIASAITAVTGFAQEVTRAFSEGFQTDGITGALSSVGSLVSEKFRGIVSDVSSSASDLSGFLGEIAGAFQAAAGTSIGNLISEIGEFGETVASVSVDVVTSLAQNVHEFFDAFDRSEVAGIIGSFASSVAELYASLLDLESAAFADIGNGLTIFFDSVDKEGLADAITDIAGACADLFGKFTDSVEEEIEKVGENFDGFGTTIAEIGAKSPADMGKIGEAISHLIENMTELATKFEELTQPIRDFFGGTLATLIQTAVGWFVGGFGDMADAVAALIEFYNDLVDIIQSAMEGDIPGAFEAAKESFEDFKEFWSSAWDSLVHAWDGAKEAFDGVGRDLVQGLWDGFVAKWEEFKENVGKLTSGFTSFVKGIFGIQSPSKVFAGIGENLVLGMERGWSSEFGDLERTVGDDLSGLVGTAKIGFGDSAIGRSSAAGITSMLTAGAGASSQPVQVNLVLDGDVAAKVLYDPLRRVAWQKDAKEAAAYA